MRHLFIILCIGLHAAVPVSAQTYVRITMPSTKEFHVSNIMEPVLLEGECSSDIQSIAIEYRFTPQSNNANARALELVDTYVLRKFVPGSGTFLYRIFPSLGNLGCGTNEYTVVGMTSEGTQVLETVIVYSSFYFGEKAKPVVYLYPLKETRVGVNVRPLAGVSVSDPPLGSGWNVIAYPDGRITNLGDGKDYPYLFWESPDESLPFARQEGFIVPKNQVESFFREKLVILGLNAQEINDFVEFWIEALVDYPFYQFYFLPMSEIDRAAPLDISQIGRAHV